MKRFVSLFLLICLFTTFFACKEKTVEDFTASGDDISLLEKQYEGRTVFYGEMHDHSASGGTSDGKFTLVQWKILMPSLGLDFAAILDHKQVLHMYSGDWDDTVFIGGSEAASASIAGSVLHYNMIFTNPEGLLNVLKSFPEFGYTGGTDGHFIYPVFTRKRFTQLVTFIKENGGYLVLPHPMSPADCRPASNDPDCFYYGDYTGLEVLYQSVNSSYTKPCYELWRKLLKKGRRIYACAGGDGHGIPDSDALTTVYAKEQNTELILNGVKAGDSTAGGLAIRLAMGDTVTGGHKSFADNERLVISTGDFHKSLDRNYKYRIKIYKNEEEIADLPISSRENSYFALDVDKTADYYRAVVYAADTADKTIFAYSNPIFNDK